MRMLVYDCYLNGVNLGTVNTFKEAKEWREKSEMHITRERLVNWVNDDERETEKMKAKRFERAKKRVEAIRKKARKAAVG